MPVSGPPIDVEKDQSMVGRDPSCEIVVTDGSVSRRHARLERRGAAWWVVDQGSANGTYVNSLRVAEQALRPGQELRFGALAYRVELVEDPEATVATPIPRRGLGGDPDGARTRRRRPDRLGAAADARRTAAAAQAAAAAHAVPRPAAARRRRRLRPSAAAARERFKQPAAASPVPQMPAGAPPAKKGRSPLVWMIVGCCGCLLLVRLLWP